MNAKNAGLFGNRQHIFTSQNLDHLSLQLNIVSKEKKAIQDRLNSHNHEHFSQ